MKKIFFYPIAISIISATALSNPMPIGGPGKTVVPYLFKSGHISLEDEKIYIKANQEKEVTGFVLDKKMKIKYVRYDCTYVMKNSTSRQITMNVGFPFYSGDIKQGPGVAAIEDFEVQADNVKIKPVLQQSNARAGLIILKAVTKGDGVDDRFMDILIKKKYVKEIYGQPDLYDISPMGRTEKEIIRKLDLIPFDRDEKDRFRYMVQDIFHEETLPFRAYTTWYYFPVTFKPGGLTTLHITYNSSNGNYNRRSFYYVLKTGKFWKGNIGKCVVNINLGKNDNLDNYTIFPQKYKVINNSVIRFEWINFSPDEDVIITNIK